MSYQYKDIELFPEIFIELLVRLCSGELISRTDAIARVKDYHKQQGGVCNKDSYVSTFKNATQTLRRRGYNVTNPAYGMWRIDVSQDDFVSYRKVVSSKYADLDLDIVDTSKEIGYGDETVYVYYYPVYRKFSMIQGRDYWCCKIGYTTKTVWDRIVSQSTTAFPEKPHVGLIIKCANGRRVEQAIHATLKAKDQWIETAPGKEWFLTSPSEVENLYNALGLAKIQ